MDMSKAGGFINVELKEAGKETAPVRSSLPEFHIKNGLL
jgi:hypothetical protein